MAKNIKVTREAATINTDALDVALKAALTKDVCYGLTIDRSGVWLVMADTADDKQVAQAVAIVTAHDPEEKTAEQAKREAIEAKATENVATDAKVAADVSDAKVAAIIVNLLARVQFLEDKLGIDRSTAKA